MSGGGHSTFEHGEEVASERLTRRRDFVSVSEGTCRANSHLDTLAGASRKLLLEEALSGLRGFGGSRVSKSLW